MAPALTVKAVRTAEKTRVDQALAGLQQRLVDVDAAKVAADDAVRTATAALAGLQRAEAVLHQAIAAAPMPAQKHQLEVELEQNLLDQRSARADLATAQDDLALRGLERVRVAAAVEEAKAQAARADVDLVLAGRDDDQATAWRAALGGADLQDVVAAAGAAPVAALVTGATDRLVDLLGNAEMLDLLRSRFGDATSEAADRAAAADRAVDALEAADGLRSELEAAVTTTGRRFSRLRDEVRVVVEQSALQLAAAELVLLGVAAFPALTAGDQERIADRAAAAVAGDDAAALESARNDARRIEREAAAELERVALPKEAVDPAFDRATDPSVQAEREAWEEADADRQQAEGDFDAQHAEVIEQWEVAIPPEVMALATDALRAVATTARIAAVDLPDLTTRFDTAEEDHATALEEAAEVRALTEAAAALAAARMDEAAAVAPVADLRLAALVRGDQ